MESLYFLQDLDGFVLCFCFFTNLSKVFPDEFLISERRLFRESSASMTPLRDTYVVLY